MNFTNEEKQATSKLIGLILADERKPYWKQTILLRESLGVEIGFVFRASEMRIKICYAIIEDMSEESRKDFCDILFNVISAHEGETLAFSTKAINKIFEQSDFMRDLVTSNAELNAVISEHNFLSTAKFRY